MSPRDWVPKAQLKIDYVAKSQLKSEFGLTDSLIRAIGDPDQIKLNPHCKRSAPMNLYRRDRIETWIKEHSDAIASAQPRKQAALKAVETKRAYGREALCNLASTLKMMPTPSDRTLEENVSNFLQDRYNEHNVSQKAICSYIRHVYTNYDQILDQLSGLVGKRELYEDFKVYLCCLIIEHYKLDLAPVYAALGSPYPSDWPDRFLVRDVFEASRFEVFGGIPSSREKDISLYFMDDDDVLVDDDSDNLWMQFDEEEN